MLSDFEAKSKTILLNGFLILILVTLSKLIFGNAPLNDFK